MGRFSPHWRDVKGDRKGRRDGRAHRRAGSCHLRKDANVPVLEG